MNKKFIEEPLINYAERLRQVDEMRVAKNSKVCHQGDQIIEFCRKVLYQKTNSMISFQAIPEFLLIS